MNHGRILVVDDDPSIRMLLTGVLEFEGLEVQSAPDEEANTSDLRRLVRPLDHADGGDAEHRGLRE